MKKALLYCACLSAALSCGGESPTVVATASSVSVTPAAATLTVGSTQQFTATTKDAAGAVISGRTITWSTSNAAVATVLNGMVTALSAGSASISATADGQSGTAAITVSPPVASIEISPAAPSVGVGTTAQLSAITKDGGGAVLSGRAVTWSSSSTNIATINATSGSLTGVAPGTSTITASSEGKSATATVTVGAAVSKLAITPPSASVGVGASRALTAIVMDNTGITLSGRPVTWSSANTGVLTVDASTGAATGVAQGTAVVTATSEGKSATAAISVAAPVAAIAVSPPSPNIAVGAAEQFIATPKSAAGTTLSGRAVAWTSSNASVARVSLSGAVTGVAVGTATITATSEGRSGTANVQVVTQVVEPMLSGNADQGCAINASAKLFCWQRSSIWRYPLEPLPGRTFRSVSGSWTQGCAIETDGKALCWGTPFGTVPRPDSMRAMPGGLSFVSVNVGSWGPATAVLALTSEGRAYGWGKNTRGALGDGTKTDRTSPVPVSGNLTFRKVVTTGANSAGITTAGAAYAWGENYSQQVAPRVFGDPDSLILTPRVRPGSLAAADVSAFSSYILWLNTAGRAFWGSSADSIYVSGVPFTSVSVSSYRISSPSPPVVAHALTSDGRLYGWGDNTYGLVGDGTSGNTRATPVAVGGAARFREMDVAPGAQSTAGDLWWWGGMFPYQGNTPPGWTGSYDISAHPVPLAPTKTPDPGMTITLSPASVSLVAGQTATLTAKVHRIWGGFRTTGLSGTPQDVDLRVSGLPAGVSAVLSPSTLPRESNINSSYFEDPSATITLRAASGAAGTTASITVTASALETAEVSGSASITVTSSPPVAATQNLQCTSESTALPTGYQCLMAPTGELTVGAYGDLVKELHGSWRDESAGLCINWGANGQATGTYTGGFGGGGTQTVGPGKWGVMVTSKGELYPNPTQWYVFTAPLDAQTKLLGYDSSRGEIVGWGFKRVASC